MRHIIPNSAFVIKNVIIHILAHFSVLQKWHQKTVSISVLVLATILASHVQSANILVILTFTSKSHYILLRPIGLELARRGHNVTIITAFKEIDPPPNYQEVMIDDIEVWDVLGGERPNIFTMVDKSAEEFHEKVLWGGLYGFTQVALNSTEVRDFLKKDNTFDLVISELFFQESFYVLAHKYKAPLVLVTTFGNCMKQNFLTGNPLQLGTVVFEYLDLIDLTSLWGRFRNAYFTMYEYFWWKFWYLEKQEQLVETYLAEFLTDRPPSLYDIQKNASLLMINRHFSFHKPAALLPNIVEIGGIHLSQSNSSLPKDLQEILDNAEHGVVYVNFGSNIRSSELPANKKTAFINVFKKLKQTVLWKWEEDQFEDKPANLVTRKWLPQKDILAHPNIKVFIAHGGLIGIQEAIFNGVPIVGVPIYADQFNNMVQIQQAGIGKMLEYRDINENTLENILNDIIYNDTYKNKAKEVSRRFKDRPMTPLDTAMFWIEYVLRHKDADFMKSPARDMSWFRYFMLDLYTVVITIIIVLAILVIIGIRLIKLISEYLMKTQQLCMKIKRL
ncbi:UDP-glycosyltransferase UGT5-like [Epargyreus clarus]|uniref:UDP-glycosyltransferase UGT5-like n=1 Tax=Epargyreus clarus TaxID=520877 RepID=UPI003C2FA007